MKILITGAKGFIGRNLIAELHNRGYTDTFEYDLNTEKALLEQYTKECDFVFHLAGVNRPLKKEEYMAGNYGFTAELLSMLKKYNNKAPILLSSSIQAEAGNPYGLSKKAGEDIIFSYGREQGTRTYVYRLANLFGKWSRPNYNSVVATFCNNIAHGIEIQVNDPNAVLKLCYIDDVIEEFINALSGEVTRCGDFCIVPTIYSVRLGKIADLIHSFKEIRSTRVIPNLGDGFTKKLYSTYLSFLPVDSFIYDLTMHTDHRGSFTELFRTPDRGQMSVNVSKKGITKGEHWHHTKNEKFVVLSGDAIIRFRKIGSSDIFEYCVNGGKFQVVDVPVGYIHSIINIGDSDLVTLIWANESFNPNAPDTYAEKI